MNKIWISLMTIGLLAACSSQEKEANSLAPITVALKLQPEDLKVNSVVTIQALVKQGDNLVGDAKDVKFEVWKDGQQKHEMIDAENKGKGMYVATENFHEPGVYHVMYHVTAREMHKMESQDFQVK